MVGKRARPDAQTHRDTSLSCPPKRQEHRLPASQNGEVSHCMPIQLPAQAFWAEPIDIEPSLHFTGAGSLKPKLWAVFEKPSQRVTCKKESVLQKTDLGILAVPARLSPQGSRAQLLDLCRLARRPYFQPRLSSSTADWCCTPAKAGEEAN